MVLNGHRGICCLSWSQIETTTCTTASLMALAVDTCNNGCQYKRTFAKVGKHQLYVEVCVC